MGDEHQGRRGARRRHAEADEGRLPHASGVVRARATARPMRVIAVDDERGVLQVVEIALSMAGHEVRSFESLGTSLAAFLEDPAAFDAAILDQNLGDGTGLELAKSMRAKNATIRIVLASGRPNEELTLAAHALQVQLLPKPFSLEGLQTALDIP